LEKHAKVINIFGECKGKGWPQICSEDDVKEIAESWEGEVGKTYNGTDVKLMLKKKQAANLEKARFTNIIDRSISINTVNNYATMLADEATIAISQSYIPKSNTSYAAENSIQGSNGTLGVIASTLFINVDKEDDDICPRLNHCLVALARCMIWQLITLVLLYTMLSHIYFI
jgi:hypothetical protein